MKSKYIIEYNDKEYKVKSDKTLDELINITENYSGLMIGNNYFICKDIKSITEEKCNE